MLNFNDKNMMKKIFSLMLTSALLLGGTSCDDFLQMDPQSSPSQSIFWQKKSDFQSALAGSFSIMFEWPGEMSQIVACFDNLTDNSICQYDENTYGRTKTIALGDLNPHTDGFVSYMYKHCYQGIARVNILLENLAPYNGTDMSTEEKSFMTAQAKALRGYFYSWLYQCYREVPLVTASLNMDNMYQPKASREEIYNQIMTDFGDAIDALPDKPYSDAQMSGYFTPGALKALKARLMLAEAYDEKGQAITSKMGDIITMLETINGYELAGRVRDNFISAKQLDSPEIMFSVRYLAPNICHSMDLYFGAWNVNAVTRDLVNAFECTDGKKWAESSLAAPVNEDLLKSGANTPESMAERAKLFINRDRRMLESLTHSGLADFNADGIAGDPIKVGDLSQTGFGVKKLLQPMTTMADYSTNSDADVVVLRYAEVLMMIAEAENELNGPTQKVYDAVNKIRIRSGQPKLPEGLSKEDMRERIRNEWRVEFAFEGHRYFQLKRWKLMEKLVNGAVDQALPTYTKVFKPAFYYFPLPQGEIDKANGVLVQDPAYN